jgi:CRISPR-associated endonuclease/helicase Cas3
MHLDNVAQLAAQFAYPFGGEQWARLAGLWHDLGKFSPDFQRKLEGESIRVVHSAAGGHLAQQVFTDPLTARVFCWLVMGHHAGLADYPSDKTGAKALQPKMEHPEESDAVLAVVPPELKEQSAPAPPNILFPGERQANFSFFIRMLFSCLIDADFLDTEAFMDKERKQLRELEYLSLEMLLPSFEAYMDKVCAQADSSEVNSIRAEVLTQCRDAAEREPAVFSLTVPTGGGKTLSSLAFALRHAVKHGKRRIIYVIPYTSIIEQTASVFRNIPGFGNAVLEHHCNLVEAEDETEACKRARLATENWDAPIIVTTNVQFFESLHACKTSRCRKLHNMADSVVIFDEAQCLPPSLLRPVVYAIRELHRHYGVTPVLCTATQPVLEKTESFDFKFTEGFESVTEIIRDPASLTDRLQRVRVERFRNLEPVVYDEIAESLLTENQSVLCIVNRKDDARILTRLLPEEQTIHLSTNMCAEHRFQTMDAIRKRLKPESDPLFVISTSLVEAGVDLDFPVVYRALAGLDSIAQAAGRCNREGKRSSGKTVVFVPEKQPAYVQSPASLACGFLKHEKLAEIFQPATFRAYFKQRFFQLGEAALDAENILGLLPQNLDNVYFRTAAEKFQLIQNGWQRPLIVPFGEALALVDQLLEEHWNARSIFRKLQRFTITIPKIELWKLLDQDHARELTKYPGTYVLHNQGLYTDRFGFIPPDEIDAYDTELTII